VVVNYWDHSGRLLGALILDSSNLVQARNRAAVEGTDHGARYCEGYALDRASAKLIPTGAIGRMLDRDEVRHLIQELAARSLNGRRPLWSRARAESAPREELTADFLTAVDPNASWQPFATTFYRNWLAYISAEKQRRLRPTQCLASLRLDQSPAAAI
jgi:hypothetical protein